MRRNGRSVSSRGDGEQRRRQRRQRSTRKSTTKCVRRRTSFRSTTSILSTGRRHHSSVLRSCQHVRSTRDFFSRYSSRVRPTTILVRYPASVRSICVGGAHFVRSRLRPTSVRSSRAIATSCPTPGSASRDCLLTPRLGRSQPRRTNLLLEHSHEFDPIRETHILKNFAALPTKRIYLNYKSYLLHFIYMVQQHCA